MKPRRSLIKLLLGSVIAGILIRYAAPPGADPVPLIGQFLREAIFNHTITTIPYEFFKVEILLWFIIFLLVALVPFMFALFSGVWGFLTYLGGFLTGYLLTPDYWFVGILCFAVGLMSALYGQYIRD
jgi:hypothetical protein